MLNGIILLFIIMKQEEIYADDNQGFSQMIILDYDFQSQIDSRDAGELWIVHQLAVTTTSSRLRDTEPKLEVPQS